MALPPVPQNLKQVSHFMKVASEHDQRDPVVAYWARFYSVQKALTIDRNSPESKLFIVQILDWLEKMKKELHANEAITNETVAQAHIENYALKLFKYADDLDRKGVFNKNVIKAFYTSSMLIDVLENFGEVSEDFDKMMKYGKWKAAYIHNCLKNGETPVSGPIEGGENEFGMEMGYGNEENQGNDEMGMGMGSSSSQPFQPGGSGSGSMPHMPTGSGSNPCSASSYNPPQPQPTPQSFIPPPTSYQPQPQPPPSSSTSSILSIEKINQAQKYTKWASSALNFDDVPTAILNLKKALHLLETGNELP